MKQVLTFAFFLTTFFSAAAQPATAPRKLKKAVILEVARTAEDDMPGTRGASIVWHPVQKKYYAAMAGNAGFPLSVFDAAGKRISPDSLNCGVDVRGLWYSPVTKSIQGNAFADGGWFNYKLNAKGMVTKVEHLWEEKTQPGDQSVGAYNPVKKQVLFLDGDVVLFYDGATGILSASSLLINFGRTKKQGKTEMEKEEDEFDEPVTPEDYNYTSPIYTGIKGAELGFLNYTEKQIELYNIADGFLTRKLQLPEEASVNQAFNFSYCNGMYWLFDIDARTWVGYK